MQVLFRLLWNQVPASNSTLLILHAQNFFDALCFCFCGFRSVVGSRFSSAGLNTARSAVAVAPRLIFFKTKARKKVKTKIQGSSQER